MSGSHRQKLHRPGTRYPRDGVGDAHSRSRRTRSISRVTRGACRGATHTLTPANPRFLEQQVGQEARHRFTPTACAKEGVQYARWPPLGSQGQSGRIGPVWLCSINTANQLRYPRCPSCRVPPQHSTSERFLSRALLLMARRLLGRVLPRDAHQTSYYDPQWHDRYRSRDGIAPRVYSRVAPILRLCPQVGRQRVQRGAAVQPS